MHNAEDRLATFTLATLIFFSRENLIKYPATSNVYESWFYQHDRWCKHIAPYNIIHVVNYL